MDGSRLLDHTTLSLDSQALPTHHEVRTATMAEATVTKIRVGVFE
jgi:hypothetical protein